MPVAAARGVLELAEELAGGTEALGRALGHPLPDQTAHRFRHILDRNRSALVLQPKHGVVAGIERGMAGQALVEDRRRRVDVGLRRRLAGRPLFRGHVLRCSCAPASLPAPDSDAEVDQSGAPRPVDEHVCRLVVAVDDAGAMGFLEAEQRAAHHRERSLGAGRPRRDQPLQRRPTHELHDDRRKAGGLDVLVEGDDVGVLNGPQHCGLGPEAVEECLVAEELRAQPLDGDELARGFVACGLDGAGGAGAELGERGVVADRHLIVSAVSSHGAAWCGTGAVAAASRSHNAVASTLKKDGTLMRFTPLGKRSLMYT